MKKYIPLFIISIHISCFGMLHLIKHEDKNIWFSMCEGDELDASLYKGREPRIIGVSEKTLESFETVKAASRFLYTIKKEESLISTNPYLSSFLQIKNTLPSGRGNQVHYIENLLLLSAQPRAYDKSQLAYYEDTDLLDFVIDLDYLQTPCVPVVRLLKECNKRALFDTKQQLRFHTRTDAYTRSKMVAKNYVKPGYAPLKNYIDSLYQPSKIFAQQMSRARYNSTIELYGGNYLIDAQSLINKEKLSICLAQDAFYQDNIAAIQKANNHWSRAVKYYGFKYFPVFGVLLLANLCPALICSSTKFLFNDARLGSIFSYSCALGYVGGHIMMSLFFKKDLFSLVLDYCEDNGPDPKKWEPHEIRRYRN